MTYFAKIKELEPFFEFVRKAAHDKAESAGFNGAMSDYGASDLREKLECFVAGLEGRIPDALQSYYRDYLKTIDPEYAKYLELRQRFDGQ